MDQLRSIAGWPALVRAGEGGSEILGYDSAERRLVFVRAAAGENLSRALSEAFGHLAPSCVPSFSPPYRSAAITVTGRCNMRCPYCFVYPVPRQADMPPETAARAVRALAPHMAERAQFYLWGGEPTLNLPACEAALDAMQEALPGRCRATVTTNGTASEEAIRRLASRDFCRLQISFDGPRAVHERHKLLDGGSYGRVLRAIDTARSGGSDPILRLTVTQESVGKMRSILEDIAERGLSGSVCVEPVHSYVGRSRERRFAQPDAEAYVRELFSCLEFAKGRGIRVHSQPLRALTDATPYRGGFVNILPDGQAVSTVSVVDSSHPDAPLYRVGALEGNVLRHDEGAARQQEAYLDKTARACGRCPLFSMCTGNEQRDFFVSGSDAARYRCDVFLAIVRTWMVAMRERLGGIPARSASFRVERGACAAGAILREA